MSNKIDIKDSLEYKTYEIVREMGLVHPPRSCSNACCKKYNQEMSPYLQKRSKDAKNTLFYWRCTGCGRFKTAYDESFFSLFKKPPQIILALIKCWAGQLTLVKSVSMIKLNLEHTVCEDVVSNLFYKLRQMCTIGLDKKNLILGGPNKIVEIDESLYSKVKYNRGKDLRRAQVWVFGLVERGDNAKCYMEIVPNREALTLLNIIYNKCAPGTIVYSDCWSSYNKISQFKNFSHQTVNHSYNFIDPETGTKLKKYYPNYNFTFRLLY